MKFTIWVRNPPPSANTKLILSTDKATWPAQERELKEKVVKAGWDEGDIIRISEVGEVT